MNAGQQKGNNNRAGTGIVGLDMILEGGLPRGRTYLVYGEPGTGKTTTALHFLMEGVRQGERCLYLTLLQNRAELDDVVRSHHWNLDGVEVAELPEQVQHLSTEEQTLFSAADIELNEIATAIIDRIDTFQPDRMVLDSISELAVLVESPHQLRRQLLKLKRHLSRIDCTTVFTSAESGETDLQITQTLVNGAIGLSQEIPVYGRAQRRANVLKMRGVNFLEGFHDLRIKTGGIKIYPRLQVTDIRPGGFERTTITSGVRELDSMLSGGLETGTACLVAGNSGAGKSSLTSLYVDAAARKGVRAAIFCFDERKETYLRRSEGLGIPMREHIDKGTVELYQINVGDISPGEFVQSIRRKVDEEGIKIVVIDTLTGYMNAMPEERLLMVQLHELLMFLGSAGVLSMVVVTDHGFVGTPHPSVDASYVADTVISVRLFEAFGRIRRCLSVVKKRHGSHDTSIREFTLGSHGLQMGEELSEYSMS